MATFNSPSTSSIGTTRCFLAKGFAIILVTTSRSSSRGSIFLKGSPKSSAMALIMTSSVNSSFVPVFLSFNELIMSTGVMSWSIAYSDTVPLCLSAFILLSFDL